MKYITLTVAMMAVLLTLVTGCKKDSDNTAPILGHFIYDGSSYSLSQGFIIGYGPSDTTSFGIDLVLMSSGLTIIESGGTATTVTGNGEVFGLSLFSTTQTLLEPGNYTFGLSQEAGTCTDGFLFIQYDPKNDEVVKQDAITGGTLVVTKVGDQYDLTMNMTTYLGKTTTANFKGTLSYLVAETKSLSLIQ